jgi:PEP-CTERM motif
MRAILKVLAGIGWPVAVLWAVGAVAAPVGGVTFAPGVFAFATTCPNAPATPCDGASNATITVTVAGSQASFVVDVPSAPADDVSFTLPDYDVPTGVEPGGSPYFSGPTLTDATWDTTVYPYVIFWSAIDGGALNIAAGPDGADSLITLFASNQTITPVFSGLLPEPGTWTILLAGFALAGAFLRRRAGWHPVDSRPRTS